MKREKKRYEVTLKWTEAELKAEVQARWFRPRKWYLLLPIVVMFLVSAGLGIGQLGSWPLVPPILGLIWIFIFTAVMVAKAKSITRTLVQKDQIVLEQAIPHA